MATTVRTRPESRRTARCARAFLNAVPPLLLATTLFAEPYPPERSPWAQAETAHPVRATGAGCSYSDWSAPHAIGGAPASAVTRPSLTVRDGRGFVVFNDIPSLDQDAPVSAHPLVALTLAGGSIGRPAGDFAFAFPRAVLDTAGTLHVVWAEPAGAPPRTAQEWNQLGTFTRTLKSLWYAAYDAADGWTAPEQIYLGRILVWLFSSFTRDPAGRLHLAVMNTPELGVVGQRLPPDLLVHLVRDRGSWRRGEVVMMSRTVAYTNVAATRDGHVYIAYIAADKTVRADLGSVFLIRSLDGGASWEPPRGVSRPGPPRRPVEVTPHATPDGALHLVWSQNKSPLQGEFVQHAVSRDGGESWLPSAPLEPAGGFHTLRAVADRCGVLHATFMRWVTHPTSADEIVSELWYARRDTAWTTPWQPFPHLSVSTAALAAAPNGSVHLFVSGRPVAATGSTRYASMASELQLRGPR